MKKHLANIISVSRIICAAMLFFFSELSALFLMIYCYCGLSDFLDGKIARKLNSISLIGAKLDTAGDVITYFALIKILYIKNIFPMWALLWIILTLIGFVISAIIAKIRFDKFYFVHSLFGKILGFVSFLLPFAIKFLNVSLYFSVICIVSTIAATESIIIQLKSDSAKTDVIYIK